MLKEMNELRFKTQDKHIFIYYVFKVFISTPSLYSIYFTPFFSFIEPNTQESSKRLPRPVSRHDFENVYRLLPCILRSSFAFLESCTQFLHAHADNFN